MSTWAALLSDIRDELQDTAEPARWDDAALYLYLKDALRNYAIHFPKRVLRETLVWDEANGRYDLPVRFKKAVLVESPLDRALEERASVPGQQRYAPSSPFYYWLDGVSYLYLDRSTTEAVFLTYDAWYAYPTSEADANFVIDLPEEDEELIRMYVIAKAQTSMRDRTARLDRFRPGQGRGDNPMIFISEDLFMDYRRALARKRGAGNLYLSKAG